MIKKFQLIVCVFLWIVVSFLFSGCKQQIKVDGIQSKVQGVINGNTVELQNGLKVELLGIKPTALTKTYLESEVKGKTVIVISDSKQPQFINTYLTKVRAYLRVKGDRGSISGKMLQSHIAELNQTFVHDSIEKYKRYAYGE